MLITHAFFAELCEKHDVDDAVFLIDGSHLQKMPVVATLLIFRYEYHGNWKCVKRVF